MVNRNPLKLSVLLLIVTACGCSSVQPQKGSGWIGYRESGKASYYADKYQSKSTASGERYRHNLKTAAHRKLPFGSLVKVTNVRNGKSVVVKINDRGPFVRGRIIDLSKSAFSNIGKTSAGVINVKIEVIK